MDEKTETNEDVITKSIESLCEKINGSLMTDNDKTALLHLLDRLLVYYCKKRDLILTKERNENVKRDKVGRLKNHVTDVLVEINEIINGDADIFYFVSIMNKKMNDKEIEKLINEKRHF